MTIYSSISDYIGQVVMPALGEHAGDFDTDAIARDMTEWHDEYTDDGDINLSKSGLVERQDIGFWEVAEHYDLVTEIK